MPLGFKQRASSPRHPLSVFSKIAVVTLLIISGFWGLLAIFVPGNIALLINALVVLGIAGLVATGIRWTPLLGSLLCSLTLYVFVFQTTFPLYHLAHPKDAYGSGSSPWLAYLFFTVIVILFWCMLLTVIAGIAAVVQNYTQRERRTPRWFGFVLTGLLGLLVGAVLIGAFAPVPTQAAASSTTANGEQIVHLGISSFGQSQVTIAKGAKLLLIDDGTFDHNISTGRWVNGQPQGEQQTGEPQLDHVKIGGAGQKLEVGPFATAGTYHIYCAIHTGMTLTIIVQ